MSNYDPHPDSGAPDFSAMADLVQGWAGPDAQEARVGVLALALNLAVGHEAEEIRAWANGVGNTDYGDALTPMLTLYGRTEDVPHLRKFFKTLLDYDLRAAWDGWADAHNMPNDYAAVHDLLKRSTRIKPPKNTP